MSDPLLGVTFVLAAAVSLAASWLLVTSLERVGARLGLTEALLGLLAALAADAPEITAAVTADQTTIQNALAGLTPAQRKAQMPAPGSWTSSSTTTPNPSAQLTGLLTAANVPSDQITTIVSDFAAYQNALTTTDPTLQAKITADKAALAKDMPGMPAEMRGMEAILGKNKWWVENHEIHSASCEGPFPHGDRFIVRFGYDVTNKPDQRRMQMNEMALYTVEDDKIVREEFFYSMG